MTTIDIESDGPPAKRRRAKQNVILTNLPANEFTNKLDLFNGPRVVVKVSAKDFELPKRLLCYYSKFFEKAFSGNFRESVDEIVVLDGYTTEAFEMVVQWLFQSTVNLPSNIDENISSESSTVKASPGSRNGTTKPASGVTSKIKEENDLQSLTLSRYLDFLVLADYIQLIGPFDSIEKKVLDVLTENRCALAPQHVRSAMMFPAGNLIRQLLVRATVKEYVENVRSNKPFKFQKEFDEDDAYAAYVGREYQKAMSEKFPGSTPQDKDKVYVWDPLGGAGRIMVTIGGPTTRKASRRS